MSFMNEDKVKASISYRHMLKELWPYTKKHPWLFVMTMISVFIVSVSSRLLPTIIGYAIDHGALEKNMNVIWWCAIAFLVAEIIHSGSSFVYSYIFQKLGNRVLFYLRQDLIKHVENLPMNYFNKTPTGRIVTRLTNDTTTLGEVFGDGVINIFMNLFVILSIIVSMSLISLKLTIITLFLLPVFVYASFRVTENQREILRDSKKRLSEINSFVAENLNGIKVVQLYNRVLRNHAKFLKLSHEYRDTVIYSIRQGALLVPIMNIFTGLTISISLYYGGVLSSENALALGSLVAFVMHVQDFIPPLRESLEKYQQFQNSLTSAERVFHLLDEKIETDKVVDVKGVSAQQKWGAISIRNLNFKYESTLPYVLNNINLEIKRGQSVAVIGRTGSGKSTLISLLQKFYDVPENTIFIDGHAIENIPRPELRSRIGVIQQDNFIFRGTLKENVSLGDPEISQEKIIKALHQVGYWPLLQRSGRSLDTFIEERGANLSAGERQLLAFARILAFQPDILILDEATANIDSESEKLIQAATKEITKGRTSIIIAHRLSTVEECDQIIVLRDGQIIEFGRHSDLLEKKGLYASYVADAGE